MDFEPLESAGENPQPQYPPSNAPPPIPSNPPPSSSQNSTSDRPLESSSQQQSNNQNTNQQQSSTTNDSSTMTTVTNCFKSRTMQVVAVISVFIVAIILIGVGGAVELIFIFAGKSNVFPEILFSIYCMFVHFIKRRLID